MPFRHWRISQFPELGHLAPDQRRELLTRAGGRRTYVRIIAQGAFFGGIFAILIAQNFRSASGFTIGLAVAVLVATTVLWYQFILWRMRIKLRLAVMDGLEGERVPVCLKCGYNVEQATVDRCPECGAPLRVPKRAE